MKRECRLNEELARKGLGRSMNRKAEVDLLLFRNWLVVLC